jgi:hypothetical protein
VLSFRAVVDRATGDRSVRFWSVVGGLATTLALLVTIVSLTIGGSHPEQSDAAVVTSSPAPRQPPVTSPTTIAAGSPSVSPDPTTAPVATSPDADEPAAGEPPVLLRQVDLDMRTGVDLDGGSARYPLTQGASGVDLYLDWGYILYSSVLHSEMYDDTSQGDAAGAYNRCASYRQLGRTTFPHKYVGAGTQLCITTSDGLPGWVQVHSIPVDKPGSAILRVVIWTK